MRFLLRDFLLVHIRVGITQYHAISLQAAEPLESAEIAVRPVMPSRPGMPTIMGMKIRDPRPLTGPLKCLCAILPTCRRHPHLVARTVSRPADEIPRLRGAAGWRARARHVDAMARRAPRRSLSC